MQITIDSETSALIEQLGRVRSTEPEEVVRAAVQLLAQEVAEEQMKWGRLREKVEEGIRDCEAGRKYSLEEARSILREGILGRAI